MSAFGPKRTEHLRGWTEGNPLISLLLSRHGQHQISDKEACGQGAVARTIIRARLGYAEIHGSEIVRDEVVQPKTFRRQEVRDQAVRRQGSGQERRQVRPSDKIRKAARQDLFTQRFQKIG